MEWWKSKCILTVVGCNMFGKMLYIGSFDWTIHAYIIVWYMESFFPCYLINESKCCYFELNHLTLECASFVALLFALVLESNVNNVQPMRSKRFNL